MAHLDYLLSQKRVIDITMFGSKNDYTCQLVYADGLSAFGKGKTIAAAIKQAHSMFMDDKNSDLH